MPDDIDICLVCEREVPPGPDFCSNECEIIFWKNKYFRILEAMRKALETT